MLNWLSKILGRKKRVCGYHVYVPYDLDKDKCIRCGDEREVKN